MAVIIPDKLIFLAVPRTGSVSTSEALAKIDGALKVKQHHIGLEEVPYKTGNETIVIGIRNHWDAIATWWLLDKRRQSLYNFVYNCNHSYYARQNKLYTWLHPTYDEVIHYENMEIELNRLLVKLKLPKVILPHLNKTDGKRPWWEHYSLEAYDKVWERFAYEIELLNYKYEPERFFNGPHENRKKES